MFKGNNRRYSVTNLKNNNLNDNIKLIDLIADRIIYHNKSDINEKLIFQYYETGIGGNPNWQTIITQNLDDKV